MVERKAIYYAINDSPAHILFVKISIETLRKSNKKLKVYLFIYGDLLKRDLSFFQRNNVTVIKKEATGKEYFTSLKWISLEDMVSFEENRLMFLDADTIIFRDPDILFESFKEFDFYAREEQIDRNNYQKLAKNLGVKILPIFNTGVMIFNNSSFKEIANLIDSYRYVMEGFIRGKITYLYFNFRLIEEIVASITLGKVPLLTYGILDNKTSPWYIEFGGQAIRKTAVIMHTWRANYARFTILNFIFLLKSVSLRLFLNSVIMALKLLVKKKFLVRFLSGKEIKMIIGNLYLFRKEN